MCIDQTPILWMFDEYMCKQTQMPFIFVTIFSDIGQCFRPDQIQSLENQKSRHIRIILNDYIFLVNISSLYINQCRLQTGYRRPQTEFRNHRQTNISYFCFMLIYSPFGSRVFLSVSIKNSGNIGLFWQFKTNQVLPHNDKDAPCQTKTCLHIFSF